MFGARKKAKQKTQILGSILNLEVSPFRDMAPLLELTYIIRSFRAKPFPSLQSRQYSALAEWSKCRYMYDHWSKIMCRRVRDFQLGYSISNFELAKKIRQEFGTVSLRIHSFFRREIVVIFIKTISNPGVQQNATVRMPGFLAYLVAMAAKILNCEPFWTMPPTPSSYLEREQVDLHTTIRK